jgi:hypothetical protein
VIAVGVDICLGIEIDVVGVGCCTIFRLSAVIDCTCVRWSFCPAPHPVSRIIRTKLKRYQNFWFKRTTNSSEKTQELLPFLI